jgi:hypothetical protein
MPLLLPLRTPVGIPLGFGYVNYSMANAILSAFILRPKDEGGVSTLNAEIGETPVMNYRKNPTQK